jgi:hypothetical protein
MAVVGEWSLNELAHDVVDSIKRLDGGAWVLEGRVGKRPRSDVDEKADAVGDIVLQRPLQLDLQRAEQLVSVDAPDLTVDAEQGAPAGTNSPIPTSISTRQPARIASSISSS